nr:hypothetical protein Iba_chr08eCG0500 [Ipomoea batatas]
MTSENNCIIEDVDNACVEMPSDEIGVKEHDNFCDEPYDDSFDHNCGDAHIENVVGNVDCVVDNVHANLLENVGDINAKRDDDICDNSSNACKNATYDLHNNALKCGNDFWVDNEVNFLNPYDFNDSDSFDSSDDDNGNCVDTCENNSFNSNDNDGLESFTFDDNSLLNEHVGELHDMLCNVDDDLNVDASLLDLNEIEFDTFHDNCVDDAMYVHEFLGEVEEEMDGSERDSFTFGDESLSNKHVDDLHGMLCGGVDMNIEASLCDLSDIECVTFYDNCLDDALYIHDLIGKDRSEGVENENVKEEVEDKEKTRNESVREEIEDKVRNDEKEFGVAWGCEGVALL